MIVFLNTIPITAPMDYQGTSTVLTFSPSASSRSVNVTLFDETIVEGSEYFNGNIMGTTDLVIASPDRANVTINEDTTTDSELL